MTIAGLIAAINGRYHIEERWHACTILSQDFPSELQDLIDCLNNFHLLQSEIEAGGGGKSKIAGRFDTFLAERGWQEAKTDVKMVVGTKSVEMGTHKLDNCKSRVAIEVEWNNKDPFFSRDLNAFRMLHDLDVISVGGIITRMDDLQDIFGELTDNEGKNCGRKYGASTTHWNKLIPRVESGGGGTCPLLLIGISKACYDRNA